MSSVLVAADTASRVVEGSVPDQIPVEQLVRELEDGSPSDQLALELIFSLFASVKMIEEGRDPDLTSRVKDRWTARLIQAAHDKFGSHADEVVQAAMNRMERFLNDFWGVGWRDEMTASVAAGR